MERLFRDCRQWTLSLAVETDGFLAAVGETEYAVIAGAGASRAILSSAPASLSGPAP